MYSVQTISSQHACDMLSLPKTQSNPHQVRSKFPQSLPAVLQSIQTNYKQKSKCSSSSLVDPMTFIHSYSVKTDWLFISCQEKNKPNQNKTYQYIISERDQQLGNLPDTKAIASAAWKSIPLSLPGVYQMKDHLYNPKGSMSNSATGIKHLFTAISSKVKKQAQQI